MVKMIDGNIPIKFISQISKKEANSRKPVYQIHKWFGRKTDAIFRSILIALELDEDKISEFESLYYKDNHDLLKGKVILDPFMGGGVTLTNTLRLGGKVIGIDVNPVAWFITKNELQLPKISETKYDKSEEEIIRVINDEFEKIEKNIAHDIKELYTTEIYDHSKKRKRNVDIMYVLWVKKVKCPKCQRYTKLFPTYIITRLNKDGFEDYNICPKCGELIRGNNKDLICSNCGEEFNREISNYKGRKFICSSCGSKWDLVKDIMKERKKALSTEMYAIEYYDFETGKKGFKIPDKKDLEKYNNIKEKITSLNTNIKKFIPEVTVPEGYNTKQIKNHNYIYWRQMFNHRQLYCLARIIEEINKIQDDNLKELFLCVFSNTINANNMFCIYNSQCEKIEPLFGDHHMAPVMNPVENNVWGTKLGRGSFIKYFRSFIQSKKFNISPFERLNIDGKSKNVVLSREGFSSEFANTFNELVETDKNTILKCQSAEDLSFLPDNSIDAVITDPPYYSAINYGEISEFFYVWDRLILKDRYKFFQSPHVPCNDEVTVNESKGITKEEFVAKLSRCLIETKRVLKKKAPLILTYNNSSPEGWLLLLETIINSGFSIENTHPIHTELRAGLIDSRRDKMNYDLIIIAKIRTKIFENSIQIEEFMKEVEVKFQKTYLDLNDKNLVWLDKILIKVGKVAELYSKYYPYIYKDTNRIKLKEILEYIYNKNFY